MGCFRFALAVNVMLFHILQVPYIGPFAVYSFFILSGFLMTTIMKATYGYGFDGIKAYALNRFLRLYPVHWFLLLFSIAVIGLVGRDFAFNYNASFGIPTYKSAILANLTLIYPSFMPIDFNPRLSPPSWALTIELFFYLLIGLGLSRTKRITLFWVAVSAAFWLYRILVHADYKAGYGDIFSASLPFSIGAALYYYKDTVFQWMQRFLGQAPAWWLVLLFILNLGLCVFIRSDGIAIAGVYLNLLLSALLVVTLFRQRLTLPSKGVDRFLGDLSYPLYLCHWSTACLMAWLLADNGTVTGTLKNVMVFATALLLAILVSVIANKVINDPIEKLRRRVKSRLAGAA